MVNPIHEKQRKEARIKIQEMANLYNFTVDVNQYEKSTTKLNLICKTCNTISKKSWVDLQNAKWYKRPIRCYTCFPIELKPSIERNKHWSKAVKKKYHNTCVICKRHHNDLYVNDISLDAHHIIPISVDSSHSTDLNNGITLCRECHTYYHNIWTKKTNPISNEDYINDFNLFLKELTSMSIEELYELIHTSFLTQKTLMLEKIKQETKTCIDNNLSIVSIRSKYTYYNFDKKWRDFLYEEFGIINQLKKTELSTECDWLKPEIKEIKKFSFVEHKEFLKYFPCKNGKDYKELCNFHPELYIAPEKPFKKEWTSWSDFLNKTSHVQGDYLPYSEASKLCQKLNIKNSREYWEQVKHINELPFEPRHTYKNEWISWMHFFNWDSRKKIKLY